MRIRNEDRKLMQTIGRNIRTIRQRQKISVARLSAMADMDPSYLVRLEKGGNPSLLVLKRLAGCLGVKVEELFRDEEDAQESFVFARETGSPAELSSKNTEKDNGTP